MAKNSVQFVVDLSSKHEEIRFLGTTPNGYVIGELLRFGKSVRSFVLSPSQAKKVLSRKGMLNITEKMCAFRG